MTDDMPLFDRAHARREDPATSHAAARRVEWILSDLQQKVLEALRARGPMTCREIAAYSGVDYASVTPRIKPLRAKGLVTHQLDDEGEYMRRSAQYVWRATEEGLETRVEDHAR